MESFSFRFTNLSGYESTPSLPTTYYGLQEVSKLILKYPKDIDAQNASENTALMGVCFKGIQSIAELLR